MKNFFFKVFLLLLPVALLYIFPTYVDIKSGEFVPLSTVIEKQLDTNNPVIYGPAFSDQTTYHKAQMVRMLNPQVLALGNSKLLTLRAQFFNEGVTFYNAGGIVGEIGSFRKFLEVTKAKPEILIITVEPLYFDPLLVISTSTLDKKYQPVPHMTKISSIVIQDWLTVYLDYFKKKFTLRELTESNPSIETIGLNARINGSGFRNDGSYHYGKQYESKQLKQEKINKAITFIENKTSIESKEFFSSSARKELDELLRYCKENNIYVIGYIPPTPKAIEDTYKKYSKYDYMTHTHELTSPIFKKYGFEVYDFYSMARLGAGDEETIDEYHTSERVMLRVLINILDTNTHLQQVASKAYLKKILLNSKDQNDVMRGSL
jgi:hypothetical protein